MQWLARLPGTQKIRGLVSPGRGVTEMCTLIIICLYVCRLQIGMHCNFKLIRQIVWLDAPFLNLLHLVAIMVSSSVSKQRKDYFVGYEMLRPPVLRLFLPLTITSRRKLYSVQKAKDPTCTKYYKHFTTYAYDDSNKVIRFCFFFQVTLLDIITDSNLLLLISTTTVLRVETVLRYTLEVGGIIIATGLI